MRLLRYFIVGGISATVDLSIFIVAVKGFQQNWFFVAICSFFVATTINYMLSVHYIFQSGIRFSKGGEVSLVFLVSGLGLLINQSVLWLLIESTGIDEVLSKILATGTIFFWNYAARSSFIFKAIK